MPSNVIERVYLSRNDAQEIGDHLTEWEPSNSAGWQLHAGDIGWAMRFDDDDPAATFPAWRRNGKLVAIGLIEGPVLRLALDPRCWHDDEFSDALMSDAVGTIHGEEVFIDGPLATWRTTLAARGWDADPDTWVHFWHSMEHLDVPSEGTVHPAREDVENRVAVQRAAFANSTFTTEKWHSMAGTPLYSPELDLVVRNEQGEAVAAVTGWLTADGQCGLLEPVGTHRDHRGQGWGRCAVISAVRALKERGASGVTVMTPASNGPGVALYRSAGFKQVSFDTAMRSSAGN